MLAIFAATTLMYADCHNGICSNAAAWRGRTDDPDRIYLFVAGTQVGGYDRRRDEWRPYDAQKDLWGDAHSLRIPPTPKADRPEHEAVLNFGVNREPRPQDWSRHTLSGLPVTEAAATAALVHNEFSDDSQRLRLTVIGTEDERRRVCADLQNHSALRHWAERLHVQSYSPDHWAVHDAGFVCTGQPTIYVQAATGRVLHRQDEYRGPERLAEALRRADPNYQPDRDPDLNRVLPINFDWRRMPTWGWIATVLILLIAFRRRNQP